MKYIYELDLCIYKGALPCSFSVREGISRNNGPGRAKILQFSYFYNINRVKLHFFPYNLNARSSPSILILQ